MRGKRENLHQLFRPAGYWMLKTLRRSFSRRVATITMRFSKNHMLKVVVSPVRRPAKLHPKAVKPVRKPRMAVTIREITATRGMNLKKQMIANIARIAFIIQRFAGGYCVG
jgi:hypothetical protein